MKFKRSIVTALLLCGGLALTGVQAAPDLLLVGDVETAIAQKEFDQAIARITNALAVTPEQDTEVRLDLLQRLAMVYELADRWPDAAQTWEKGAALLARWKGERFPELSQWYEAASKAYERAGLTQQALEQGRAAFAVDQASLGAGHPALVSARQRLLIMATKIGDAEAVAAYQPLSRGRGRLDNAPTVPVPAIDQINVDFGEVNPNNFARVKVFFGTDRNVTGSRKPDTYFGGERGQFNWGTVDVSVPRTHKPGAVERPSLMSFEVRESPERHMVLMSITVLDGQEALQEMRRTLEQQDSDQAFVFVHGYNVSFADAARRTAQIAYDLNFPGLPILYSWPSRASTLDYIADTAVVRHSGRNLLRFLEEIVQKSGARRIHLVGHSMGNRALTDALELYAVRHIQAEQPAFDQVIFTAPDVDAGLFSEMVQTIKPIAKRLTLYTSDQDLALSVSRKLHGSRPRAGQAGSDILVMDAIDTVDMTALGDDVLGHSYFANDASALSDLLSLFTVAQGPESRCGLVLRVANQGEHWQFDPARCNGSVWLSAMSLWHARGLQALDYAKQRTLDAQASNVAQAQQEWQQITQALEQLIQAAGPRR